MSIRFTYSDATDTLVLETPWGPNSGNIPPPVIEFFVSPGVVRRFMFQGEEHHTP